MKKWIIVTLIITAIIPITTFLGNLKGDTFNEVAKERFVIESDENIKPEGIKITDKEWKEWKEGLNETGRFQALNFLRNVGVFILDTKQGHLWVYIPHSTNRSQLGEGKLFYSGRVLPGKDMGEQILSIPSP